MTYQLIHSLDLKLPQGTIVFISGVPGVGKTTISYELLKVFDEFRIVEETDLLREVLRGYNEYIKNRFGDKNLSFLEEVGIAHHTKFLKYDEAKDQCVHMRNSIEKIIARQKRKGISTIINGVHLVPEVLSGLFENDNIIYVNLFLNNEHSLHRRWAQRNSSKYSDENLSIAFQTNFELSKNVEKLSGEFTYVFNNIDITDLNVKQTIVEVIKCLANRLQNS